MENILSAVIAGAVTLIGVLIANSFGDASDYARSLEIHDLTFVFGQLMF